MVTVGRYTNNAHGRNRLVDNNVQVVDTSVGKVLLEKLSGRMLVPLHDSGLRRADSWWAMLHPPTALSNRP